MDFQLDATADGRRLKILNVIYEHSRLCLAIRVGRCYKAKDLDLVAVLEARSSFHPAQTYIRSLAAQNSSLTRCNVGVI